MENQLKATELRLNNLVNYNGMQLPICGIISPVFTMAEEYIIELFDGATTIDCKIQDILSIPLSEEILIKLGFEKLKEKVSGCDYFTISRYSVMSKDNIFYFSLVGMQSQYLTYIKTVHELQNLFFALTGEELTFKK